MFSLESGSHHICLHVRRTPIIVPTAKSSSGTAYKRLCPPCDRADEEDSAWWLDEERDWVTATSSARGERTILSFEEGSEVQLWSMQHEDGMHAVESLSGGVYMGEDSGDPVVFTVRVASFTCAKSDIHGILWCTA